MEIDWTHFCPSRFGFYVFPQNFFFSFIYTYIYPLLLLNMELNSLYNASVFLSFLSFSSFFKTTFIQSLRLSYSTPGVYSVIRFFFNLTRKGLIYFIYLVKKINPLFYIHSVLIEFSIFFLFFNCGKLKISVSYFYLEIFVLFSITNLLYTTLL